MRKLCDCAIFIFPRRRPSRMLPRRPPPNPPRSALKSAIVARPARTPLVAAATGAESGICSGSGRSITRASGAPARTGRLRPSSIGGASLLRAPEVLLVHPVALGDLAAHALHRAVHRHVVLQDPAHLAARLGRLLGHVEVLAIEQAGDPRVLVLRLDAQEADPHLVDPGQLPQQLDAAERQQPPVGALEGLVEVGHRERGGDHLAVLLADHHPVLAQERLHLLGDVLELLDAHRREAPVVLPGRVVDLDEMAHLVLQVALAHVTQRHAVLLLGGLGDLPDHRRDVRALVDLQAPHVEVDPLRHPRALGQVLVVGVLPRLLDHRLALEAVDQDARLVVHREVERPDDLAAVTLAQPPLGGRGEPAGGVVVVLALEEAEQPPVVPLVVVEVAVDLGADAADRLAAPPGDEQLGVTVVEERVLLAAQELLALEDERGDPLGRVTINAPRKPDEAHQVRAGADRSDVYRRHAGGPYSMPGTAIDLFEKARNHERLELLRAANEHGMNPYFRLLEGQAGPVVEMEGAERVMLGSNNYLGLTRDPRVQAAAREALDEYGTALTGSRFLNGTLPLHLELERELAEWMGTEAALVFTTGYQANVGCLSAILSPVDTVICDSGDHASIMDGVAMSRAKVRPFRHKRLDKLETMLERAASDGGGVLVVVDGVYSMEGDICDVPRVAELAAAHGARVMIDEAHGVGVLGARGAGACEALAAEDSVDLRMGTFSKSLASCGGFIAGSSEVIEYLRYSSRSFMFTASAVPAAVAAALAAVRICRSAEGPELFARVLANAAYLRRGLAALGYDVVDTGARDADGESLHSPVVPVLVGDDWKTALLWKALYEGGVYTNVALYPAVERGGALLRTSVMATHEREHLDRALGVFEKCRSMLDAGEGA